LHKFLKLPLFCLIVPKESGSARRKVCAVAKEGRLSRLGDASLHTTAAVVGIAQSAPIPLSI
jgi:hypothetical protein